MRARCVTIAIFVLACIATLGNAQTFDLVDGTVDNAALCSLVLDDVIDLLGRPSAVESPSPFVSDILGPKVFYHDNGLYFWFRPGEVGQEPLLAVTLYLSRSWDADNSKWYSVFDGGLQPAATNQWRVARSLEVLGPVGGVEKTPDEREAEWQETVGDLVRMPEGFAHLVEVDFEDGRRLVFHHEPVTRFLERVGVICPS